VDLQRIGRIEGVTWISPAAADSGRRESRFCVLSRGDRVWGRCLPAAGATDSPAVLFLGPDGSCESASVSAALRQWSSWATVASFDLPLCGQRGSQKFSAVALDRASHAGARLQEGLSRQLGEDLLGVIGVLREFQSIDAKRTALVALGPTTGWAVPNLVEGDWPRVAVIAPPPQRVRLPAHIHAVSEPVEGQIESWLEEVGATLQAALAAGRS
jgi:hypothetical protein